MALNRYMFNDESVTKVETKSAVEDQYGGDIEVTVFLLKLCINIFDMSLECNCSSMLCSTAASVRFNNSGCF